MYIREYRKNISKTKYANNRTIIVAACDECCTEVEYPKSNFDAQKKRNDGKNYCRSCSHLKKTNGEEPYKGTPLHNSYSGAKQRCEYKKHVSFSSYGERGIKFMWSNFAEFKADMGDTWKQGLSLERVNLDGNYCKDNCIWATATQQARNKRNNIHTEERAQLIREFYKTGRYSQLELGELFNDSQGNISNIITGRTWQKEYPSDKTRISR